MANSEPTKAARSERARGSDPTGHRESPSPRAAFGCPILIVEDEPSLLASLSRGLSEQGFAVEQAVSAEAAEEMLKGRSVEVIVLDVRLPGKSGLDLLRDLRAAGNPTPVLILTARGALEERVAGLDSGADDYLVKPFAYAELVARLKALVRRRSAGMPACLRVADLEFDTLRHRATRAGRPLHLSPKENLLLELLMRHAGEAVTRDMIAEVVWGAGFNEFTNLIEVFVKRLRRKIDDGRRAPLIVTLRGVGYSMRGRQIERSRAGLA